VPFPLNRVDGIPTLRALQPENVSVRGDEAMIELSLSEDHDIELYFPALDGAFEPEWLSLAGDVLTHLTAMDNEVQRASAEQWAGSPYPSSYYEGDLAYITLTRPGEALLHYFVVGCNSEWDERFVRCDGQWARGEHA
jgi:hypothetical protein